MQLMSPRERDYTLRILGDYPGQEIFSHLFTLSRHTRKIQIYEFLIKQNIVGKSFIEEIRIKHQGSILNFMAAVVKKIDSDVVKRPVLVGRDWI